MPGWQPPAHCDSVADGYGVEFEGCSSRAQDSFSGGFGELFEVYVSWDYGGVAVSYADERFGYVTIS